MGLGASDSVCTASPLSHAAGEGEPAAGHGEYCHAKACWSSWQPLPGLLVACGDAMWSILPVECPSLG